MSNLSGFTLTVFELVSLGRQPYTNWIGKLTEKDISIVNKALDQTQALDLAEIRIFDGVGTEKFAEHAFNFADKLIREATDNRCYVVRVECAEHGANSAIYEK